MVTILAILTWGRYCVSSQRRTISIRVAGCKVNQVEADLLLRQFEAAGWRPAAMGEAADLVLVHTCTVTARADRDSRKLAQAALAENSQVAIAVSGCLAELDCEQAASWPGVVAVIGQGEREHAAEIVAAALAKRGRDLPECGTAKQSSGFFNAEQKPYPGRARAWIKIEDGCDGACTFCRVRLARGPVISRPLPDILAEARAWLQAGYQELVFTGVNLGCWRPGLAALISAVAALPGHFRFRLSSLEPQHIDLDLISALRQAGRRFCPHLHLALQSGDNDVLKSMGRSYTVETVRSCIAALRVVVPDLVVTADVIVGFPGETEEAFAASRRLATELGCTRLQVFPFSPRPGTAAATYPGQHPERVRSARARALRAYSTVLGRRHRAALAGRRVDVLLEGKPHGGIWQGTTEGYERALVQVAGPAGRLVTGRVTGTSGDCLQVEGLD
jgi:threonylcarbamoyladenosine tRNA methylthiotransferase MtaB